MTFVAPGGLPTDDQLRRQIPGFVDQTAWFRVPPTASRTGQKGKEWLHFCVRGKGFELLVNLSVFTDLRQAARPGSRIGRVIAVARTDDGRWEGGVDDVDPGEIDVKSGRIDAKIGPCALKWRDGVFELAGSVEDAPIRWFLRLRPETAPWLRPNTTIEDGALHWLVVPRLVAEGLISIGDRVWDAGGALAYHDHNWGSFSWGDDLAWLWGFVLPEDSAVPWTLVFARLTDGRRTHAVGQGMALWDGPRQLRAWNEGEIRVRRHGQLRARGFLRVPRVMALVYPEAATDVPARLTIEAQARGERIFVDFRPEGLAQISIPAERDLSVTWIHETTGPVVVDATIRGQNLRWAGRGMFEFLASSPAPAVPIRPTARQGHQATPGPGAAIEGRHPRSLREYVSTSLELLRREHPGVWTGLVAHLDRLGVAVTTEEGSFLLRFLEGRPRFSGTGSAEVTVQTTTTVLRDLLRARCTLLAATLDDRLHLRGTPDHLLRFLDGLALWFAGAVRSPSFPALLHRFAPRS